MSSTQRQEMFVLFWFAFGSAFICGICETGTWCFMCCVCYDRDRSVVCYDRDKVFYLLCLLQQGQVCCLLRQRQGVLSVVSVTTGTSQLCLLQQGQGDKVFYLLCLLRQGQGDKVFYLLCLL